MTSFQQFRETRTGATTKHNEGQNIPREKLLTRNHQSEMIYRHFSDRTQYPKKIHYYNRPNPWNQRRNNFDLRGLYSQGDSQRFDLNNIRRYYDYYDQYKYYDNSYDYNYDYYDSYDNSYDHNYYFDRRRVPYYHQNYWNNNRFLQNSLQRRYSNNDNMLQTRNNHRNHNQDLYWDDDYDYFPSGGLYYYG